MQASGDFPVSSGANSETLKAILFKMFVERIWEKLMEELNMKELGRWKSNDIVGTFRTGSLLSRSP